MTSAGRLSTGAVVSTTVMTNDLLSLLLWVSVAVQVTVVGPRGKFEPDGRSQFTGRAPSTRSIADTVYVTVAPDAVAASWLNDAGTVIAGAVVSATFTLNEPLVVLLWASVAEQFTAV